MSNKNEGDIEMLYQVICDNCRIRLGWVNGQIEAAMLLCDECSELPWPLSKDGR